MTFVVPSIVEVSMNKLPLWINIRANDWTAERAIIANNAAQKLISLLYNSLLTVWTVVSVDFKKYFLKSRQKQGPFHKAKLYQSPTKYNVVVMKEKIKLKYSTDTCTNVTRQPPITISRQ